MELLEKIDLELVDDLREKPRKERITGSFNFSIGINYLNDILKAKYEPY